MSMRGTKCSDCGGWVEVQYFETDGVPRYCACARIGKPPMKDNKECVKGCLAAPYAHEECATDPAPPTTNKECECSCHNEDMLCEECCGGNRSEIPPTNKDPLREKVEGILKEYPPTVDTAPQGLNITTVDAILKLIEGEKAVSFTKGNKLRCETNLDFEEGRNAERQRIKEAVEGIDVGISRGHCSGCYCDAPDVELVVRADVLKAIDA